MSLLSRICCICARHQIERNRRRVARANRRANRNHIVLGRNSFRWCDRCRELVIEVGHECVKRRAA